MAAHPDPATPSAGAGLPLDLGSWIGRRAETASTRPALTFEGRTLTYGQFLDRIDRLAAELAAGGVGHGDRVGYAGINHPTFLETLFACGRIGAVFVPLNFRLAGPEMAYIIGDAGLHTLVADADRAAVVDTVRSTLSLSRVLSVTEVDGWEALEPLMSARAPLGLPTRVTPDEVAIVMYTSGTTGRPKGVMLTHANLFWNNVNAMFSFDSSQNDVTLVAAPLFHIGGLNVNTLITLQKAGEVVLTAGFDPAETLALIERRRVTTMFGVPAMFLFMAQHPEFADTDLSSLRSLVCGGAPVPEPLIRIYHGRGVPFVQGYGLTETAPLALVLRTDESATKIGAAGHHTLMLSEVRLVDPHGIPVPTGETGEVCVRGPQVMVGYWHNPAATAAAIDEQGWFHTGDLGRMDDDGYVYIVDRTKDMVISGGENVYPAEVESVLYDHPAIREVAVIGTPDARWGEAVTAVVAAVEGPAPTLDDVREFCRDRLAGYKIPLRLEIVDEIPRNPAGKILKYRLREQFGGA
ncbi:acyl-CoA synthetase [Speluncibacter jeojiensis]|uniref:Long-chain fatty acid--CoA ligase n=1 Tax=Speluncibacter jeojiensis TaxID=2710754 RepID=A0A9X4M614_9ACTN|nr:long-chain fatty acid--CoA ligase [Rhodococcus sp. D2-41]MDG3015903.1 long-chain fatty acid--CoA ligase [Corynebacteriales bacterium D3-21]